MNIIGLVLMMVTLLAVLASLIAGLVLMSKGGEANKKYGNRLMQVRVYLQGFALVLFAILAFTMSGNN